MLDASNTSPYWVLKKAIPGTLKKGQDAVSGIVANGVTAITLGDGVTSAGNYASFGAAAATIAASHFLSDKFDEIISADEDKLRNFLYIYFRFYYLKELDDIAKENALPPVLDGDKALYRNFRLYSTTIIACGVKGEQVIIFKIGNGVVVANTGNGFGVVSSSEIVHGETPCIERLYDPGFSDFSIKRYCVPSLESIVIMSDGVEHAEPLLYDERKKLLTTSFSNWFVKATESDEAYSKSIDDLGLTSEDDISIAMLIRNGVYFENQHIIALNPFDGYSLYTMRTFREAADRRHRDEFSEHQLPVKQVIPVTPKEQLTSTTRIIQPEKKSIMTHPRPDIAINKKFPGVPKKNRGKRQSKFSDSMKLVFSKYWKYPLFFIVGFIIALLLSFYVGREKSPKEDGYTLVFNAALDAFLVGQDEVAIDELQKLNKLSNVDSETIRRAHLLEEIIELQTDSDTSLIPTVSETEPSFGAIQKMHHNRLN